MSQKKLKPQLPKGFVDYCSNDLKNLDAMIVDIASVYELYGFERIETPLFEYTESLGKFLPDEDRPNQGVFSLQDDDEKWLSLRYDLTAPLARHFAQHRQTKPIPYRTYRVGQVFRNEKPGPGRYRQFMQIDADSVGGIGAAADSEMCMMMADVMEKLGIKQGEYIVKINSRKVLDEIMQQINLQDEAKKLAVLRSLDKFDKFGVDGVAQLLGKGRMDDSGDFTKGAGLEPKQIDGLINYLQNDTNNSAANSKAQEELQLIENLTRAAGYTAEQIKIDSSIVRGLEYYTGAVYECELTFNVPNEKGENVVFGAVAGGGRYDDLIKRFTGEQVPATGFSIGVSRLQTALKNLNRIKEKNSQAPVLVCVMDKDEASLIEYQNIVQTLRKNNICAELYLGNPKQFGKQLKYADQRGCPLAIIQGSDERTENIAQIKDLKQGKQMADNIDDNETWRQQRVAQISCKTSELVPTIKKMLGYKK